MRLAAVLVTAILSAALPSAQGPPAPAAPTKAPSGTPPYSVEKIRAALARKKPPALNLDQRPVFRVEIVERQKIEALLKTLDFNSGPAIPGGIYGYDQQQRLFPAVNYPGMQPYAAFAPNEMVQVSATSLIENYMGKKVVSGISTARSATALKAARAEVRREIVDYCAAQPNGGAGIQICDHPPDQH